MRSVVCAVGVAVCVLVVASMGVAEPPAAAPGGGQEGGGGEAVKQTSLRVLRTRELRERLEPGVDPQSEMLGLVAGPPRGDGMMLDLALVGVPESARVVDVEMVSASAKDDLGNDLVGPVVKAAGADPAKLTRWTVLAGEAGPAVRWWMASPARKAASIDATLVVRARVAMTRDTVVVRPGREWRRIEHPSLDELRAECRWSMVGGTGPYLELRPRGAEALVSGLSPRPAQFRGRAAYSLADSKGVAYMLEKGAAEGAEVRLEVLGSVQTYEATLSLERHPLP